MKKQDPGPKKTGLKNHLWRTGALTALAVVIYYVPTILLMTGRITASSALYALHDYYAIDVYALAFFAPVAYAAYNVGVKWALATAFFSALLLFPYSIPNRHWSAMLQPTALAVILAAVGAAIAMLQRSEEQQSQRTKELECLYLVGRAAEESSTVDDFLTKTVETIGRTISGIPKIGVFFRGQEFVFGQNSGARTSVTENLTAGDETVGKLEIFIESNQKQRRALARTLAERISGAVREIELGQSLHQYYEQLEDMVEKRSRELEKAQEKLVRTERLAAVGELASSVSHELRNPLNVIKNCVYLLGMNLEKQPDDELKETLAMINQQVNISNRIVTDLLDFTRTRPPTVKGVELTRVIKDSLSWVTIPDDIKLVKEINTNGSQVLVDADQIGRALANVVSNAVQAIDGHGEIRVTANIDGDAARIDVDDTGCGIPESNLDKVFEPLFTTKAKGTGLGLAISKKLVEQNGGSIGVTSQVNKGTRFSIRLPLERKGETIHGKSA